MKKPIVAVFFAVVGFALFPSTGFTRDLSKPDPAGSEGLGKVDASAMVCASQSDASDSDSESRVNGAAGEKDKKTGAAH